MAYAQVSDLTDLGISREALARLDDDQKRGALQSASDEIDMALRSKFVMPLMSWGADIKQLCVDIAVWRLMRARGYNPESGADQTIRMAYEDATSKLTKIANGTLTPNVVDSTPAAVAGEPSAQPRFSTASPRGWSTSTPSGAFENKT